MVLETRKIQLQTKESHSLAIPFSDEFIAVDTESDGGGTFGELKELHSIALWNDDIKEFHCVKWRPGEGRDYNQEWTELLRGRTPIFHNAAHDVSVLRAIGIEITDYEDSLIIGYNLNPNRKVIKVAGEKPSRHGIVAWGARLGFPKLSHPDWDIWRRSPTFYEELEPYNLRDAEVCWNVFLECYPKLKQDERAFNYYVGIDRPFIEAVIEMNSVGMYVDQVEMEEWKKELTVELQKLYDQIYVEIEGEKCLGAARWYKKVDESRDGVYVNLDNPDPTRGYQFRPYVNFEPTNPNHIKYIYDKRYNIQLTSTDKDNLPLAGEAIPLTKLIMDFREMSKLINTYCAPFKEKADKYGYVKASWKQTLLTGRVSSENPSLQTLPARTELGATFRKFITVPDKETHCIVVVDLDQIEIRIQVSQMATMCMERLGYIPEDVKQMIEVFDDDEADFHQVMADLWGVVRKLSKTITFARAYGAGVTKLAFNMGITKEEARSKLKQADSMNPSYNMVKDWVLDEFRLSGGLGYTLFGRRLVYPSFTLDTNATTSQELPTGEIVEPDKIHEWIAYGERQAFNARIQGTQADIIKAITNFLLPYIWYLGGRLSALVHDELVFICPRLTAEKVCGIIDTVVNGYHILPFVKVAGKAKIGDTWYDAK